jgi:hypothetical protein
VLLTTPELHFPSSDEDLCSAVRAGYPMLCRFCDSLAPGLLEFQNLGDFLVDTGFHVFPLYSNSERDFVVEKCLHHPLISRFQSLDHAVNREIADMIVIGIEKDSRWHFGFSL